MRITSLTLRNFKGISRETRIDLAPITLLFGPNSAGKSTILQALHYLREVLERGNLDPDTTLSGGSLNLGGFVSLVHQHDRQASIYLKLEIDLEDYNGSEHLPINAGYKHDKIDFSELLMRYVIGEDMEHQEFAVVQSVGIGLAIQWSEMLGTAYLARYEVYLDEEPLLTIQSPVEPGRALVSDLNFNHPMLAQVITEDQFSGYEPDEIEIPDPPLEALLQALSPEYAADARVNKQAGPVRVPLRTKTGALIDFSEPLHFELRDPTVRKLELESSTPRVLAVQRLLAEWLQGPARIAIDALEAMRYIGPLREVPCREFRPQASPEAGRWASGLAAWDLLHGNPKGLVERVDDWMVDPDKLNLGYGLARREFREIETPGPLAALISRGIEEQDIPLLEEYYAELPTRVELSLYDATTRIALQPQDVGVGLSQLIPIIVAAEATEGGLVAIEQPELHLHPAVQVAIADLFIAGAKRHDRFDRRATCFLIETHSEHLMLRLLRRVRETSEDELPPWQKPLAAEELAVHFVQPTEDGVTFTRIRIDQDGEFIDRWPAGFFEERLRELM